MRLRSVLFTPADRPERVQKAWANGAADLVVADLEDGVAPQNKRSARDNLHDLRDAPADRLRGVRINAWPSEAAEEDLRAAVACGVDVVVVPKVEDPAAIAGLHAALSELDAPDQTGLLLILETALGVWNAAAVAAAGPRVKAIAFGAEDFSGDVGITRTPDNSTVAVPRALIPIAAATVGIAAIDMITADFTDQERVAQEAQEAAALGYVGKMCIHPAQVEAVHAAMAPSEEDVQWAKKIMAAADGFEDGGVAVVDGTMVDVPVIKQAKRILARARG